MTEKKNKKRFLLCVSCADGGGNDDGTRASDSSRPIQFNFIRVGNCFGIVLQVNFFLLRYFPHSHTHFTSRTNACVFAAVERIVECCVQSVEHRRIV